MLQKASEGFGFDILIETKSKLPDINSDEDDKKTEQKSEWPTVEAQILQSILEYSIEYGIESYFKSRDLSENYLLDNCRYYVDLYKGSKMNIASRKASMNPRVVENLEKLVVLELLEFQQYTTNNNETSKEYRFTKLGRMVGLLLLCDKIKNIDTQTYDMVYSQIYDFYNSLKNSHSKTCLVFFDYCKEEEKFNVVLNYLIKLLFTASNNKEDFLNQIKFLNLVFRDSAMFQIFKKSMEHMKKYNREIYEMFMLNLKLSIEEKHEYKSRNLAQFEITRMKKFKDIDEVVLEGFCNFCHGFLVEYMNSLEYLDSYIQSVEPRDNVSRTICQRCSKGYLNFEIII